MLGSPVWAAVLLQRYLSGKSRPGWRERWGHLSGAIASPTESRPRIWVHAVSAGEVVAAIPIVREIRSLLPDFEIVFSATTAAGMEMARQQAAAHVDELFYFPLDLPWVARAVVKRIDPRVFVSLESELWPNILHELKRHGARTVMVNGRISERNFRRAQHIGGLFRWMFSNMDRLLVQSEADAERIRRLGASDVAERITIVGNSKFDQEIAQLSEEAVDELRRNLHLPADAPVFVAGSTRSPEEEHEVIRAYALMRAQSEDLCLVIAPRQIDRADELVDAMLKIGLEPVRRTALARAGTVKHLVLDTIGELANVYAIASFAFVGNSLGPVVKGGGQNLLQPLAHGKAVFYGPRIATIRAEADLAEASGVGFEVANGEELARRGRTLLENEAERMAIGERARALIARQRGVSHRYAAVVAELARGAGAARA